MRAAVRHFISPDVDLSDFRPDDPHDFAFLLQALIGPAGSEGEESLQFLVCTPRNLERRLDSERVILGRSLVIVNSPDIPQILSAVQKEIERPWRESWPEVASQLTRLGIMEFEDYM